VSKKRRDHHRPQQRRPTRGHHPDSHPSADPEAQPLIRGIRSALRAPSPLDLLVTISGLMEAADPRSVNPFERSEKHHVTLDELVTTFADVDLRETSAALAVIATLSGDELLRARCRRALAARRQPLPDWLHRLDEVRVARVVQMSHVLGDGDDYFLDVRIPGHATTVVVYVDHNMGTVVKDAFPADRPVEEVLDYAHESAEPDTSFTDLNLADARRRMSDAIAHGASVWMPLTSESWPQLRPLVEWLLRGLPEGGAPYPELDLSEMDRKRLAEEFLGSPFGAPFDDPEHRALLEYLLLFGASHATGDPLRWSPVNVEVLLVDWFPRTVVGGQAHLAKLPELLRAFIEFSHDRLGIRGQWTVETLQAVDRWTPEYQRLTRSLNPYEDLERAVGGESALANLGVEPLPDEPFDWTDIRDDVRERVAEILDLCDQHADAMLDVEHRTAERRLLSRLAVSAPDVLRRGAARTSAAAIVWLVARANESTSYHGPLTVTQLLAPFGVSSASQRAQAFRRALGIPEPPPGEVALGTPDLLVARRRADIVRQRDLEQDLDDG
jgi:hypothetical protein